MAKSKRTQIKQDLLEQLERNCTVGEQYTDLVEDYLALWDTKKMLIKDIKTRGAVVEYESNTGTKNMKKNESVSELVKVNMQMIKLLSGMGISPSNQTGDDDDEMQIHRGLSARLGDGANSGQPRNAQGLPADPNEAVR